MNIELADVLAGLIANAFTTFMAKMGHLVKGDLAIDRHEPSLHSVLQSAIEECAEQFEWRGPGKLEEVCLFLHSPDAESTVREIFVTKLADNATCLRQVRDQFAKSLLFYIGHDCTAGHLAATELFDQLIPHCEGVLEQAIDRGILAAHEAKSNYRHQLILDELEGIKKRLAFAKKKRPFTMIDLEEFETKYREQVSCRHAYIIPAQFDGVKKLPIEQFYVRPSFTQVAKNPEVDVLSLLELLAKAHRFVLLGDPGGGKSTLTSYLCRLLASHYLNRHFANRLLTPLHVTLRDYGAFKKTKKCSLIDFVTISSNAIYQIKPPKKAIEHLLVNGRVLVILDGLDELLDTSYRREITDDIELFCNLFPETPMIVTSRYVGYDQAPLNPDQFPIIRLSPLSEEQIKDYVNKWFGAIEDDGQSEYSTIAASFLDESRLVKDLRSNPLMLSLLCSIYRGERYIPKYRPEVYEKCALMLFERWDKSRGIKVELPFEPHIRPAMMYLASWIYSDPQRQSGVTKSQLVKQTSDYLSDRCYEDREEAIYAAEQFVDFCKGRAWVFSDTGTTESGEPIYQFTHRTFLEFFAAAHLVRTNPTPHLLSKMLIPRIVKGEWDVVAQLAFQIQNKNVEDAGNKLLQEVLRQAASRKRGNWQLLQFAGRCLEFLVPAPSVIREIVTSGMTRWIEDAASRRSSKREASMLAAQSFIRALASAATENRKVIQQTIEDIFTKQLSGFFDSNARTLRAFEVGMGLSGLENEFVSICKMCSQSYKTEICTLAKTDLPLCVLAWRNEIVDLEFLFKHFGVESAFSQHNYESLGYGVFSIAQHLIWNSFQGLYQNDQLSKLGKMLLSSPVPWCRRYEESNYFLTIIHLTENLSNLKASKELLDQWDTNSSFALLALFAIELEIMSSTIRDRLFNRLDLRDDPLFVMLSSRERDIAGKEIQSCLAHFNLNSRSKELLSLWMDKKLDFTKRTE